MPNTHNEAAAAEEEEEEEEEDLFGSDEEEDEEPSHRGAGGNLRFVPEDARKKESRESILTNAYEKRVNRVGSALDVVGKVVRRGKFATVRILTSTQKQHEEVMNAQRRLRELQEIIANVPDDDLRYRRTDVSEALLAALALTSANLRKCSETQQALKRRNGQYQEQMRMVGTLRGQLDSLKRNFLEDAGHLGASNSSDPSRRQIVLTRDGRTIGPFPTDYADVTRAFVYTAGRYHPPSQEQMDALGQAEAEAAKRARKKKKGSTSSSSTTTADGGMLGDGKSRKRTSGARDFAEDLDEAVTKDGASRSKAKKKKPGPSISDVRLTQFPVLITSPVDRFLFL